MMNAAKKLKGTKKRWRSEGVRRHGTQPTDVLSCLVNVYLIHTNGGTNPRMVELDKINGDTGLWTVTQPITLKCSEQGSEK